MPVQLVYEDEIYDGEYRKVIFRFPTDAILHRHRGDGSGNNLIHLLRVAS